MKLFFLKEKDNDKSEKDVSFTPCFLPVSEPDTAFSPLVLYESEHPFSVLYKGCLYTRSNLSDGPVWVRHEDEVVVREDIGSTGHYPDHKTDAYGGRQVVW